MMIIEGNYSSRSSENVFIGLAGTFAYVIKHGMQLWGRKYFLRTGGLDRDMVGK
jgi:hypothetical protein